MELKTTIKTSVLVLFVGLALHGAFFGEKGILRHRELVQEIVTEQLAITEISQENATLNQQIAATQGDSFPREKIAREDLQMSCTNEYVYLLKDKELANTPTISQH